MEITFSDICAVIPAAGCGYRMKTNYPKQYLYIGKKTILEHSIETLLINQYISKVIIAVSNKDLHLPILKLLNHHPKIKIVQGGETRAISVLAGIQAAGKVKWILVHDAVRPCLHQQDLMRLLEIRNRNKIGGILATRVKDTIKRTESNKNIIAYTIDRIDLWHALTPQFFFREILQNCLMRAIHDEVHITDEASALEHYGFYPELVEGRSDNIKITTPEDLNLANFYITNKTYQENLL